jgi:RNA polymerase sigma factor (sigma-70 family)
MNETSMKPSEVAPHLGQYKSALLPFAYNITGDWQAAEDVVQEVLNHHLLNGDHQIENPKNYLIRSVINRSINEKKLLRNRMEQYRGAWLPTPVLTEDSIYAAADREKILQYSLLILLEHLTPKERAVFILKETFDFNHEEIAEALDIKIEHSRQLLKRSKEKIPGRSTKAGKLNRQDSDMLRRLSDAISSADVERTKQLLSTDVRCVSDGGTKVRAARKLLTGQDRVSKFLKAIYGKYFPEGATTHVVEINHHPAILFKREGKVFRCIVLEMEDDAITNIFIVVNPDKLQHL